MDRIILDVANPHDHVALGGYCRLHNQRYLAHFWELFTFDAGIRKRNESL